MKRRAFLKSMSAGAGYLVLNSMCASKASQNKPNIVLCMADDQGWGDMGYYGHPELKTPNFDAMAAENLRFDHFYAAAPVCSPTRGSVMTGRHPNRFGCFKWGHTLRPQEITIAEALKQAGYVTGHFGKWHLGSVCKNSPVSPGASGFDEWLSAPNFFDNDPILSREGTAVQTHGESSMVTADAAIEFIEKHANQPHPFLAVVWFGSPHNPHQAIEQDRLLYANSEEKYKDFYGEITGMDRAFGKLRNRLKSLGIADNTILWYCSDNGGLPGLAVTGGREFKGSIYEGGLRVPAILEWPAKIKAHRVTNVPCNTADIYPTLLDIVGVTMPNQPKLDGVSLTGIIDRSMDKRPKPMGFWSHPTRGISTPSKVWMKEMLEAQQAGGDCKEPSRIHSDAAVIKQQYPKDSFPGHSAWLDWPWKLHRIEQDKNITLELYNLEADPMEEKDLTVSEPEKTKSMLAGLDAWLVSVVNSLNGKDYKKV